MLTWGRVRVEKMVEFEKRGSRGFRRYGFTGVPLEVFHYVGVHLLDFGKIASGIESIFFSRSGLETHIRQSPVKECDPFPCRL